MFFVIKNINIIIALKILYYAQFLSEQSHFIQLTTKNMTNLINKYYTIKLLTLGKGVL